MSAQVRIFGLRVIRRAPDAVDEPGMIACFDFEVGGIVLHEARLFRRPGGYMVAAGPSCESRRGGIRFEDPELHAAITKAACDVARQFGADVDHRPAE